MQVCITAARRACSPLREPVLPLACLCRTVFGVKANVRDNIHFVEDNIVIYPAGAPSLL